jgi:hypothetical protein
MTSCLPCAVQPLLENSTPHTDPVGGGYVHRPSVDVFDPRGLPQDPRPSQTQDLRFQTGRSRPTYDHAFPGNRYSPEEPAAYAGPMSLPSPSVPGSYGGDAPRTYTHTTHLEPIATTSRVAQQHAGMPYSPHSPLERSHLPLRVQDPAATAAARELQYQQLGHGGYASMLPPGGGQDRPYEQYQLSPRQSVNPYFSTPVTPGGSGRMGPPPLSPPLITTDEKKHCCPHCNKRCA